MKRIERSLTGVVAMVALFVVLAGCGGGGGSGVGPAPDLNGNGVDFGRATLNPSVAGAWSTETVDAPGNIGWVTSIATGPGSPAQVRIAYYDQVAHDLKLASGVRGGPWILSVLDSSFDVGKYNSIVWDGESSPAIAYYSSYGQLKAHQGSPIVVDPNRDLGAFNSVTRGPGSSLHVSYTGTLFITSLNKRAQLRHAFYNGSSWSTEVVEDASATAGSFLFSSIGFQAGPETYDISYRGQNGRLKHASGNTGSWTQEEVLPGNPMTANVGQTSILVAADDTVHIFYSKAGAGAGLYHAWNSGSGWNVEFVAAGYGIMTPHAAAEDLSGALRVAAYKSDTKDLVVFTSGSWSAVTVDSTGDVGQYASIAVDSNNCLHVSYVNNTAHDLKYASLCSTNSPPQILSISATPNDINEGGTVSVSVTANDPDGDPLTYAWSQVTPVSPSGLFATPGAATSDWRAPPIASGPLVFTLKATVCDPLAACVFATVEVTVEDIFDGPAAGTTGAAGVSKCVPAAMPGPAGFVDSFPGEEQSVPLMTRDPGLYNALKAIPSVPTARAGTAFEDPSGTGTLSPASVSGVPPLSTDFPGLTYTGLRPPDPHIAAGPAHVLAIVNSNFAIFNKTGTNLFQTSGFSWFAPVNTITFIFDPKVNYDAYNSRWLLLFHALDSGAQKSQLLLAASQTSDPTGCWWLWSLDFTVNGSTVSSPKNWADYSDMGFDGNYIYLSSNQFEFSPTNFDYTKVRVLKASEVYIGAVLNWVDYWNQVDTTGFSAFTIRPAYSFGSSPPFEYLANAHYPGDTAFTLWGIASPFSATPGVLWENIPVAAYTIGPDAVEQGTACRVDTIDSRLMNVVWRDGNLWTVQNTGVNFGSGPVTALKIHHVNTNTFAVLDDFYYGADGMYYYDGAVMQDISGNLGVVFARSSSTEYPSARYTVKRAGNAIESSTGLLKAGVANVTDGCGTRGARWGDYSGNWMDPDNLTYWIFHEYAVASPTTWGTWVGSFQIP